MKKIIPLMLFLGLACSAFTQTTELLNAGLTLPKGFKAEIIAGNHGKVRHLAATPNGIIYAKLSRPFQGKGIMQFKDLNGDGIMDTSYGFGNFGGTGIAIKNGYLYASSNNEIFRYQLNGQYEVINPDKPERIVKGLLNRGEHETKSITLDNVGNIYVNIGAYSNSCQEQDRRKGSPALNPCPILDSAGGIWQFKVDKIDQTYKDGVRYATGLRNVVGLDWNTKTNTLFVMMHGRDQLNDLFPELYDTKQSAELPAECMYELKKGDNCGWPYMYYDHLVHKKIQAPEYGGDGKKEASNTFLDPAIAFPGHLAPNGLLFYTGSSFSAYYKNGAFIAFHGSWNRAPEPQEGYYVVFVPFANGKPTGKWEIFANGFTGKEVIKSTRQAEHRPCGLAQAPDGSLLVSDDTQGTIYRISYKK